MAACCSSAGDVPRLDDDPRDHLADGARPPAVPERRRSRTSGREADASASATSHGGRPSGAIDHARVRRSSPSTPCSAAATPIGWEAPPMVAPRGERGRVSRRLPSVGRRLILAGRASRTRSAPPARPAPAESLCPPGFPADRPPSSVAGRSPWFTSSARWGAKRRAVVRVALGRPDRSRPEYVVLGLSLRVLDTPLAIESENEERRPPADTLANVVSCAWRLGQRAVNSLPPMHEDVDHGARPLGGAATDHDRMERGARDPPRGGLLRLDLRVSTQPSRAIARGGVAAAFPMRQ